MRIADVVFVLAVVGVGMGIVLLVVPTGSVNKPVRNEDLMQAILRVEKKIDPSEKEEVMTSSELLVAVEKVRTIAGEVADKIDEMIRLEESGTRSRRAELAWEITTLMTEQDRLVAELETLVLGGEGVIRD